MSSSDDKPNWLGILGVLGGILLLKHLCNSDENSCETAQCQEEDDEKESLIAKYYRKKEEKSEHKRKNSYCLFNDGISEQEFQQIVIQSRIQKKRVQLTTEGPIVYGTVCSQSGLSTWYFKLDFNDFGHITGRYWETSDNADSSIPECIAGKIKDAISEHLSTRSDSNQELKCETPHNHRHVIGHTTKRKRHRKFICWTTVLLFMTLICSMGIYMWNEYIPIGVSSSFLQGKHYKDVVKTLQAAGFNKIQLKELDDLNVQHRAQQGTVSEVIIGSDHFFTPDSKFLSFTSVVVSYHTLTNISPSYDSCAAEDLLYYDLIAQLKKDGFTNIRTEKLPDLVTGWITDENSVAKISIDGYTTFSKTSKFDPDSEIVITYHTFDD